MSFVTAFLTVAITLMVISAFPIIWMFIKKNRIPNKVIALDAASSVTMSILVLMAAFEKSAFYIDAALVLAALSFLSTVSISKYLTDKEVF